VSRHVFKRWYLGFQYAVALSDLPVEEIAEAIGEPPEVVGGWLELRARYRDSREGAGRGCQEARAAAAQGTPGPGAGSLLSPDETAARLHPRLLGTVLPAGHRPGPAHLA